MIKKECCKNCKNLYSLKEFNDHTREWNYKSVCCLFINEGKDGWALVIPDIDKGHCEMFTENKETRSNEKTAYWFKRKSGIYWCSNCNSGYSCQPTIKGKPMFKYCPICGARMVEE